eukprot:3361138-Amphidinium_carterae.1
MCCNFRFTLCTRPDCHFQSVSLCSNQDSPGPEDPDPRGMFVLFVFSLPVRNKNDISCAAKIIGTDCHFKLHVIQTSKNAAP